MKKNTTNLVKIHVTNSDGYRWFVGCDPDELNCVDTLGKAGVHTLDQSLAIRDYLHECIDIGAVVRDIQLPTNLPDSLLANDPMFAS